MVWHSSEASIQNREISFLAILEIVLAISLYWGIAVYYDFYLHIIMSVFLTPFLLLKSKESISYSLDFFAKSANFKISLLSFQKKVENFLIAIFIILMIYIFGIYEINFWNTIILSLSAMLFAQVIAIIFIISIIKVVSIVKYILKGIYNININWFNFCFVIDVSKIPELIPNIETDERISNDFKLSFFMENIKKERSKINVLIRILVFIAMYISSIFYRFSIKSTFWFYIPLLFLVKTPSIIENNSQKVGEFLSSLYETYLAKFRFILALITLILFAYSYFNYVDFANLNIPFTQFLILFYIDISNFEIWRIFQLSIVLSTIFIFLGSNAIRVPKISNNLELKKDLKVLTIFYLNIFRNWVSFFYFSSAFLYLFFYFDGINTMYLPMGIKSFLLTIYNFIMYKPFN
ncbi:MAG: hypothetical protein AB7U51_03105 [Arcobacter sp.]|uniref:hypothetical protein n=1 Tax=Arcobacter sp. TaxID=1872629 RepID=UPI003D049BF2